jgi:DNA-3-methyladenine glycosylase
MSRRADRAFFSIPAQRLAPRLIGCTLVRILDDGTRLSGRIVETEAYVGVRDMGCHSRGGRRTARNEAMYRAPGTSYIYFTYGMHHCMNIVCGKIDEPVAVLLRAIEPLDGIDAMARHRAGRTSRRLRERDLCSGPARLCQALALDTRENMLDMTTDRTLYLEIKPVIPPQKLLRTARIGLGDAGAWTHKPLRWLLRDCPHVSPARPPQPVRASRR